jgi:hypothetical protein
MSISGLERDSVTTFLCHAPFHAYSIKRTVKQSNKLPNLVTDNVHLTSQVHSHSPGISSNDAIALSAKSNSGFWISFASSITFFGLDILLFGIQDTGAWFMIARATTKYCAWSLNAVYSQCAKFQDSSLDGRRTKHSTFHSESSPN